MLTQQKEIACANVKKNNKKTPKKHGNLKKYNLC